MTSNRYEVHIEVDGEYSFRHVRATDDENARSQARIVDAVESGRARRRGRSFGGILTAWQKGNE